MPIAAATDGLSASLGGLLRRGLAYRHNQEDESHGGRLPPDYTDAQAPHIHDGNEFSEAHLLPFADEWFENIRAPQKRFVWFKHSAHEPMSEEPGKFTQALIRYARPLAEAVGDVAPD